MCSVADICNQRITKKLEYESYGSNGFRMVVRETFRQAFEHILSGLLYLHELDIQYGDIEPSNNVLSKDLKF